VTTSGDRQEKKDGGEAKPLSRLEAALARGEGLELKEQARPVRHGECEAEHVLLLGGRALGEVHQSGRGYLAYDEARAAWVGPYKRLADLARFFLGPDEAEAARPPPVVMGVRTSKGRAPKPTSIDLRPKKTLG
jgi:hypothetical protein